MAYTKSAYLEIPLPTAARPRNVSQVRTFHELVYFERYVYSVVSLLKMIT
jgi:hypothetical protein